MNDRLDEILDDLAVGFGTDAPYFRTSEDRLYLTGIEIAGAIAVGLVSSYLAGLYKGAKEKLAERGAEDGRKLIEAALRKLADIKNQIVAARHQPDVGKLLSNARSELLLTVDVQQAKSLIGPATDTPVLQEVTHYLREIGYPEDVVKVRALELVSRLRAELER